jgi:hypothetical protein
MTSVGEIDHSTLVHPDTPRARSDCPLCPNERDVILPMSWEESGQFLLMLRHPLKYRDLRKLLRERIGLARMKLANDAAKDMLKKLEDYNA